jgi:hypothetical protein
MSPPPQCIPSSRGVNYFLVGLKVWKMFNSCYKVNFYNACLWKVCCCSVLQVVCCETETWNSKTHVPAKYRSPTGHSEQFQNKLENIITFLDTSIISMTLKQHLLWCHMYLWAYWQYKNNVAIVKFPTRSQSYASTDTDNVFIFSSGKNPITVEQVTNWLSHH